MNSLINQLISIIFPRWSFHGFLMVDPIDFLPRRVQSEWIQMIESLFKEKN